jgi:uncharacterized protein (TIGR04255 family)
MIRKVLKNKPLVEAIFELRWNLQAPAPGMRIDPHYKLLIGRIYDRVKDEYPFHEQLPTATMPDEIAGYVIQHRFRKSEEKWPLIQIGPGIITLNDTDGYVWEDFEKRIIYLINALFEAYPDAKDNLKVNGLLLRYIDATAFDFEKEDIFSFLKEQLKTNINLYRELFEGTEIGMSPLGFDLKFSFPSAKPRGVVHLRFFRAEKRESDALIWETAVQSVTEDAPEALKEIAVWINDAHNLTDNWFFKLIEGELQRRFE